MKCKKCGAELPAGVKFCDICGTKIVRETYEQRAAREAQERAKAKKRRKIRRIAIGGGILVLLIVGWAIFGFKDIQHDPDLYKMKNRVSVEQYNKLSKGLTYEQVKDELGRGAVYNRFGNSFSGYTSYVWPGEYIDKGLLFSEVRVYVDHKSKKVDQFSERNVIDGKEIFENMSKEKKAFTKKKKEEIEENVVAGMRYEQVADFMGIEGILKESESDSDGRLEKQYTWHYYDEYDYESEVNVWFNKGKVNDIHLY